VDLLAVLVGDSGPRRGPRVRAEHHAVLRSAGACGQQMDERDSFQLSMSTIIVHVKQNSQHMRAIQAAEHLDGVVPVSTWQQRATCVVDSRCSFQDEKPRQACVFATVLVGCWSQAQEHSTAAKAA
jgi:hypothetical protein